MAALWVQVILLLYYDLITSEIHRCDRRSCCTSGRFLRIKKCIRRIRTITSSSRGSQTSRHTPCQAGTTRRQNTTSGAKYSHIRLMIRANGQLYEIRLNCRGGQYSANTRAKGNMDRDLMLIGISAKGANYLFITTSKMSMTTRLTMLRRVMGHSMRRGRRCSLRQSDNTQGVYGASPTRTYQMTNGNLSIDRHMNYTTYRKRRDRHYSRQLRLRFKSRGTIGNATNDTRRGDDGGTGGVQCTILGSRLTRSSANRNCGQAGQGVGTTNGSGRIGARYGRNSCHCLLRGISRIYRQTRYQFYSDRTGARRSRRSRYKHVKGISFLRLLFRLFTLASCLFSHQSRGQLPILLLHPSYPHLQ